MSAIPNVKYASALHMCDAIQMCVRFAPGCVRAIVPRVSHFSAFKSTAHCLIFVRNVVLHITYIQYTYALGEI